MNVVIGISPTCMNKLINAVHAISIYIFEFRVSVAPLELNKKKC